MNHTIHYGEYDLTIDDKNRLLIPSEVRKRMSAEVDGDAFFILIGKNGRPWFYAERFYESLAINATPTLNPTREELANNMLQFAMASRVEWDKQGRILVPEKTLKRTGTRRDVTLLGVRDHLELWNVDEWEYERQSLMKSRF